MNTPNPAGRTDSLIQETGGKKPGNTVIRRLLLAVALVVTLPAVAPSEARAQATLEGTIHDSATGGPLAGAQVSVADMDLGATTGPGGTYRITSIPAGTHRIKIQLIGYRREEREVTVGEGQTARLDLSLVGEAVALEGLVAVGSRARPRTVTESPRSG